MIDFMKYRWIYFVVSVLVIVPGIISLFLYGLRPAIDFTGGTLYEIRFTSSEVDKGKIESGEFGVDSISETSEDSYLLRLQHISREEKAILDSMIGDKVGEFEEVRYETVGPALGVELIEKTVIAVVLAALSILLYVSIRFKNKMFGVSAVIAMLHDSLILIGTFSLLGHFYQVQIDTLFVTAVLTILSFSVHDTIVVYDRIRELNKTERKLDFEGVVNKAVNETLIRSLNNSLTIIFMLTALVVLGGETIKWFVVALLIGTIAGTYSSTFTAAPLLVVWDKISSRRVPRR